jgi:hypothetical protein
MGDWHFSNWVRFVVFVFLTSVTVDERQQPMIVLSSPATLTGAREKKTGPSRFNEDFF